MRGPKPIASKAHQVHYMFTIFQRFHEYFRDSNNGLSARVSSFCVSIQCTPPKGRAYWFFRPLGRVSTGRFRHSDEMLPNKQFILPAPLFPEPWLIDSPGLHILW